MAEKKYKVAKDVALTAKGVIYKPGDQRFSRTADSENWRFRCRICK